MSADVRSSNSLKFNAFNTFPLTRNMLSDVRSSEAHEEQQMENEEQLELDQGWQQNYPTEYRALDSVEDLPHNVYSCHTCRSEMCRGNGAGNRVSSKVGSSIKKSLPCSSHRVKFKPTSSSRRDESKAAKSSPSSLPKKYVSKWRVLSSMSEAVQTDSGRRHFTDDYGRRRRKGGSDSP